MTIITEYIPKPANDITITFPSLFTGVNTITSGDLTVRVNGGAPVAISNFTAIGQVVTFDGVTAATTSVITIQIAPTRVTNPAVVDDYEFVVTTQPNDLGRTRVAIVDTVEVTAVVNTSCTLWQPAVLGSTGTFRPLSTFQNSGEALAWAVCRRNEAVSMAGWADRTASAST
jgi:hypothetical protein